MLKKNIINALNKNNILKLQSISVTDNSVT